MIHELYHFAHINRSAASDFCCWINSSHIPLTVEQLLQLMLYELPLLYIFLMVITLPPTTLKSF